MVSRLGSELRMPRERGPPPLRRTGYPRNLSSIGKLERFGCVLAFQLEAPSA
jgi:hypothetical protein